MRSLWMRTSIALLSLVPVFAQAGLSPAQQEEVSARLDMARSLVARYEAEASRSQYAPAWKLGVMQNLLGLSSGTLRTLASDAGAATPRDLMQKARAMKSKPAGKALGDQNIDLVFVPITPCRLADTRWVGGPIIGGTARGFSEEDSGLQGGDPTCSGKLAPYPEASAYALNLTALNMSVNSFVAVRPVGATETTSILNFIPGQQVNNFVIVQNLQNSGNEFEVYADATVDIAVDVFGIFLPPAATALQCVNTAATGINLGANATDVAGTSPACAAGYTVVSGNCSETGVATLVRSQESGANAWTCAWDNGASPSTATVSARCCRVPGR